MQALGTSLIGDDNPQSKGYEAIAPSQAMKTVGCHTHNDAPMPGDFLLQRHGLEHVKIALRHKIYRALMIYLVFYELFEEILIRVRRTG